MVLGGLRRRTAAAMAGAAMALGLALTADAAVADPYVASAHFTHPGASFYREFGAVLNIRIAGRPNAAIVCVSGKCKGFFSGVIDVAGPVFGQYWRRGQSRQVKIFACRDRTCMTSVWVRQLRVP